MVYLETLSCSLSLAFLAEVARRGYQREGFSGFLRAVTVTERAILLTVNALSPPRPRTRPRFALSRSDWAIHFPTQTPVGWFHARSLHLIRTIASEYLSHSTGSTVYIACRASGSRYALGPYTPVDPLQFPLRISGREGRARVSSSEQKTGVLILSEYSQAYLKHRSKNG